MLNKKPIILMTMLWCFLLIFGCSGLQKPPVIKNYFDLNILAPAAKTETHINQGSGLLIKELLIAPEFDSHSFVYLVSENEYTNDFYNEFISYPARLISDKIKETLYATKYFTPFLAQKQQDVSFRLFGKITHLYGDMQNKNAPKAIMEIRFILEKKVNDTFEKVFTKTYRVQEPLSAPEADLLVKGWSKGLKTIVSNFLNDIQHQNFNITP